MVLDVSSVQPVSPEERTLDSNLWKLFSGGSEGINTALRGDLELLRHTRGWFFNEKSMEN